MNCDSSTRRAPCLSSRRPLTSCVSSARSVSRTGPASSTQTPTHDRSRMCKRNLERDHPSGTPNVVGTPVKVAIACFVAACDALLTAACLWSRCPTCDSQSEKWFDTPWQKPQCTGHLLLITILCDQPSHLRAFAVQLAGAVDGSPRPSAIAFAALESEYTPIFMIVSSSNFASACVTAFAVRSTASTIISVSFEYVSHSTLSSPCARAKLHTSVDILSSFRSCGTLTSRASGICTCHMRPLVWVDEHKLAHSNAHLQT